MSHTKPEARLRQITASVRAVEDGRPGEVEARVTTFGNEYPIGFGVHERIAPGAFAQSLAEQQSVPVFYEHAWSAGPIGNTTEYREDDDGLVIRGQLYVDGRDPDPRARAVHRAMQAGALREWSIGFLPTKIVEERNEEQDRITEVIEEGILAEASVVVRGANPETATLAVRSLNPEQKRALRDALEALGGVDLADAIRVQEEAAPTWVKEVDPDVLARAMEVAPLREFMREQVASSTPPAR